MLSVLFDIDIIYSKESFAKNRSNELTANSMDRINGMSTTEYFVQNHTNFRNIRFNKNVLPFRLPEFASGSAATDNILLIFNSIFR